VQFTTLIVIITSTIATFLTEKTPSFSQILKPDLEQEKFMAAGNKDPKNMSVNVRNRLKFAKISKKD